LPGVDFLQLDPATAGNQGLTSWLTDQLRGAIADGRLHAGLKLPATRVLAAELGISRGVVTDSYQRLVDEGRIIGQRGGGTTVVSAGPPEPQAKPAMAEATPDVLDLSPGIPDIAAFPRSAWIRAERAVFAAAGPGDLGYGDPRGLPALRNALARWLARTRGVRTDPSDLLIVGGVAQALALIAQVLRARGVSSVAVEEPGSMGARDQLGYWGLATPPVRVDEAGLDVEGLAATGAAAVMVTPAHQFPTGVVLRPDRRRALLAWAAKGNVIVEDDYDAEHRYDRPPVPALQGLAPEFVVHTGSVSKTLAPALRLGWLVAPSELRQQLADAKRHSDLATPSVGQLVLARLIESGELERHLRLVRRRQRRRRDVMLAELHRRLPQAQVHGVAAGLHLLVTLPDGYDDLALAEKLLHSGIKVQALSWHRQLPGPPGLVLGYAAQGPEEIRSAIRRISRLVGAR
jgi:GntR family transcriptional regulator/MocR family aminotransferase